MSKVFIHIVNMSISAGYAVLAVLLLRLLFKKAPKWLNVAIWGIVALRLIMPFSFESILSIIPSAKVVSPDIMTDSAPSVNTGIPIVDAGINWVIGESFTPSPETSVNPLQIWIPIFTAIWLFGVLLMLSYLAVSYIRIKRKVSCAVIYKENIYQADSVSSPFVLGFFKPKIYAPFGMEEKELEYVIAHERAHIMRKDYIWKPLGFVLLTVYWFNPLFWIAYVLLCRDIEFACDEKVIKELSRDERANYSEALLKAGTNRRMIAACPLAFGEVGVKGRIKSVLSYKKPAFWIILVAIIACIVFSVCLLTNPEDDDVFEPMPPTSYTDYEGIYVTLDESENVNLYTVLKFKWRNETDKEATFGERFDIEYQDENGEWIRVGGGNIALDEKGNPQEYVLPPGAEEQREFSTIYYDLEKNGKYRLVAEFSVRNEQGALERFNTGAEFSAGPDSEIFNIPIDESFYRSLDASEGLDVYVSESYGGKSYNFILFPHSFEVNLSHILVAETVSAEEMSKILKEYDIDGEKIYIIPYHPPFSSWMSDYFFHEPGEDFESKQAAYIGNIRDMLLK